MRVLMVEPGIAPYEAELDGLDEMQAAVGGMIQAIYPYQEPVALVCNEEGLINGLPFNRSVPGGYEGVFGPFFVCGLGEENFRSLTPEQIGRYKKEFHYAELPLVINGRFQAIKVQPMKKPQKAAPHRERPPEPER